VYSGASHRFSKEVMDIVDSVDKNIKLAISNNNLICCGEGVCGACTVNINGQRVKTCKSQVDSRDYLNSL
jgi:succinate dehydrogenase/fumarate reductase-like Fe-S protein